MWSGKQQVSLCILVVSLPNLSKDALLSRSTSVLLISEVISHYWCRWIDKTMPFATFWSVLYISHTTRLFSCHTAWLRLDWCGICGRYVSAHIEHQTTPKSLAKGHPLKRLPPNASGDDTWCEACALLVVMRVLVWFSSREGIRGLDTCFFLDLFSQN